MKIKRICFIAGLYPTTKNPQTAVFYKNLVHQFAKMNIECKVIYPYPINYETEKPESVYIERVYAENSVTVYRPKSITFGAKNILFWNTAYLTSRMYLYSIRKQLNEMNWKPDVFYGHFISPAGIIAARLSKETGIPAFIAYGESDPWSIRTIGIKRTIKELKSINGFIAVSTKNKRELENYRIAASNKIEVFPNSVDLSRFKVVNKIEARNRMGWDQNKFIVAFVGHFNDRKGILRLDEAIKEIPDAYAAYAGNGDLQPKAENTIFKGIVPPDLMPTFLSAADVFVLPTLHEGSCNAILEAMACGLPIISSNKDFNNDILFEDNSIKVDPENIYEISTAIKKMIMDKNLRENFSRNSLMHAKKYSIEMRAQKILKYMNENLVPK